jgi:hypothetical protein
MGIRTKLQNNVQPHLEPGETLQAVFPAQSGPNPWLIAFTGLIFIWLAKLVIIAVTDRRILVFKRGMLVGTKPTKVVATFPRDTRLEPVSGTWGKLELGGTRYFVHKRFRKDIGAANAAPAAAAPASA